jgi:serine phosphatase RsbU (regulator of sigma subunit)/putative methionine-R-sulfoxide reductase with GAF domain
MESKPSKTKTGIAKKFLLIYLIISIPLLLIIATTFRNWYRAEVAQVLLERTSIATSAGESFTLLITEIGRTMRHMGREIISNNYSQSRAAPVLEQLIEDYPTAYAVLTTPSGKVVYSTDKRLIGKDLSRGKAFKEIIQEHKQLGIGNSERSQNYVGFYVTQAVRLKDNKLSGIMASFIDVTRLSKSFPTRIRRGGINLVDSSGHVIYQSEYPSLAREQAYWGKYSFIHEALKGKSVVGRFTFPATGTLRLVSEIPVSKFGWAVGSSIDYDDSVQPILINVVIAAFLALLVLLIAGAIGFRIAKGIIDSLKLLVARSRAIGDGKLDELVSLDTGDEIEDVADSLDEARINLKRAIEELNTISRITDVAISTLDLDELLNRLLDALVKTAGADTALILINNNGMLIATASVGIEEEVRKGFSVPIGVGFAGNVALTRKPQYEEDAQTSQLVISPAIRKRGVRSMVGIPLIVGDVLIGVLHVDWFGVHKRDSREIRLLNLAADRIALAVSNAQLYERTEEELSRTRLLRGIAVATATTPDAKRVAKQILDELSDHLHIETGAVFEYKEDIDSLMLLASLGLAEESQKEIREVSLSVSNFLPVRAVKNNQTMTHNEDVIVSEDARIIEKINLKNSRYVAIPFSYRGRVLGAIAFSFKGRRNFTSEEMELFDSISRIIGQAFENTRLFGIEKNIADTLQEALLTIPDSISGIEFDHYYRSAAKAAQVGGDFYDIFELEHDRVGVVIGDVSGKGIEAATITSTVKNAIKAFAYEHESPDLIMERTNEVTIRNIPANIFVTVFLGILNLRTQELLYCSAGHPPVMVKHGSRVESLQVYSPILGAFQGLKYNKGHTGLLKGDILVLYTDGIIEARCDGGFYGEDGLEKMLSSIKTNTAKGLPQAIVDDVLKCSGTGGVIADDIAILTLSVNGFKKPAKQQDEGLTNRPKQ